jgi:hypothetical protein
LKSATSGRVCELRRHARKHGARSEEHQAEVPQRMQQQNRQHDRTRLEPRQHRDEIKLGRDRKDDRAEQEIDGEDVHLRLPPRIDAKDPAPE